LEVEGRCTCGPKHLRLRSEHGELVRPRGGSVNRCDYCAKLAAVENTEMLLLDALEGDAPQVWACVGTRTATLDMSQFYRGLEQLLRALRRRWPATEYAAQLEFTTGYGPRSGGQRRPHWNLMLKGVPVGEVETAAEIIRRVWCQNVDALPERQHVGPVTGAEGLMRYIAQHFQKESQAPPAGFTGQRFNCSRGYFTGCTRAVARSRARQSLRLKREVWKAQQRGITDAYDVELVARQAAELAARTRWVLASETGARLGREPIGAELVERMRSTPPPPGPYDRGLLMRRLRLVDAWAADPVPDEQREGGPESPPVPQRGDTTGGRREASRLGPPVAAATDAARPRPARPSAAPAGPPAAGRRLAPARRAPAEPHAPAAARRGRPAREAGDPLDA
jgi:hypothetical protein